MEREVVLTKRECPARLVPAGTEIVIPSDTFVTITQALGGSFTVVVNGNLARVEGKDADALGKNTADFNFDDVKEGEVNESHIWEALRAVFDPEIPVNIVDLGLVYNVSIGKDGDKNQVHIEMTLTAPGCGMGPVIADDVKFKVSRVPNVDHVDVELVFDPPWNNDMLSEEAKLELGML
ncbi:putative Fe-S cluster assembly protein SufT [Hahella sp. CCB-MM4]|uniref:putative Fe-S cluster assembly protein SufT n=1 Tax=Hahella sp. (strain CCB-MM4) TaxID=1926491 RepID=UPI000B9C30A7|nr:putative Fe-S cluster assembly protein SufT [Hahella sp. CCB-MM4]OZG71169.1 putative Fe-S cluster assembly protein SufT [Hahella sp. CCB-MM4]